MSRSWIERLRRGLAPSGGAGLALGRDYLGYAELAAADGGWRVEELAETGLDAPLFSGAPTADAGAALRRGLDRFAGRLKGRYLPVHVSLPDALVRWSTFELDQLPRTRAAQLDLVRFRFGRQGTNGAHVYACQALAHEGDKHLLFGMATDGSWQRLVSEALADAGVEPWTLSANACRTFNRFHDRLTQASGALVAAAPDAWALWIWDERGRPRHARGRWRAGADDHAEIALEAERAILAYVHGDGARSVSAVFVSGGAPADAIADALDARLREPCVRLPVDDGAAAGAPVERVASAALSLAAALER